MTIFFSGGGLIWRTRVLLVYWQNRGGSLRNFAEHVASGANPRDGAFAGAARLPWDVGKIRRRANRRRRRGSHHSAQPIGGRDWPPRRHGGPERIRGFTQQVERSLYLLRFFPSFCYPPAHEDNDGGVWMRLSCGLSRRRRRRSCLFDLSAFRRWSARCTRSIDTSEDNSGWKDFG